MYIISKKVLVISCAAIVLFGCNKKTDTPQPAAVTINGAWNLKSVTPYIADNGSYDAGTTTNYTSGNTITFNADGTGTVVVNNVPEPFTYTDNQSGNKTYLTLEVTTSSGTDATAGTIHSLTATTLDIYWNAGSAYSAYVYSKQ